MPAHPFCMCHLEPIVTGMLDNEMPKENIENGGKEYLNSLTKLRQEQLLGIHGRQKFLKGYTWKSLLRGYYEEKMVARIGMNNNMEKGITKKKNKGDPLRHIDKKVLHSEEFSAKFNSLDNNKKVNKTLESVAKKLLIQADGRNIEQLFLIDKDSGNIISKSDIGKEEGIKYNKEMLRLIKENPNQFIAIHNHPNDNPPTGSDFASLLRNKYNKGYVITKDLVLFEYNIPNKDVEIAFVKRLVDRYASLNYKKYKNKLTNSVDGLIIKIK